MPLPDENKSRSAKELIARFQSNISSNATSISNGSLDLKPPPFAPRRSWAGASSTEKSPDSGTSLGHSSSRKSLDPSLAAAVARHASPSPSSESSSKLSQTGNITENTSNANVIEDANVPVTEDAAISKEVRKEASPSITKEAQSATATDSISDTKTEQPPIVPPPSVKEEGRASDFTPAMLPLPADTVTPSLEEAATISSPKSHSEHAFPSTSPRTSPIQTKSSPAHPSSPSQPLAHAAVRKHVSIPVRRVISSTASPIPAAKTPKPKSPSPSQSTSASRSLQPPSSDSPSIRLARPTASSATKSRSPVSASTYSTASGPVQSYSKARLDGTPSRSFTSAKKSGVLPPDSASPSARQKSPLPSDLASPLSSKQKPMSPAAIARAEAAAATRTTPRKLSQTTPSKPTTRESPTNTLSRRATPATSSTVSRLMRPTASSAAHARDSNHHSRLSTSPDSSAKSPSLRQSTISSASRTYESSESSVRKAKVAVSPHSASPGAVSTVRNNLPGSHHDNIAPSFDDIRPKIGVVIGGEKHIPPSVTRKAQKEQGGPSRVLAENGVLANSEVASQTVATDNSQTTPPPDIPEMQPGSEIASAANGAEVTEAAGKTYPRNDEEVFAGFGSHRPVGKIGAVKTDAPYRERPELHLLKPSSPSVHGNEPDDGVYVASTESENLKDSSGARDGASPSAPSPGLSVHSPMDHENQNGDARAVSRSSSIASEGGPKKVPIWMRKNGE